MNKFVVTAALLFVLTACVPGNQTRETWSRSVFAPSEASSRMGCLAAKDQPAGNYIGQSSFKSEHGIVDFRSAPGQVGGLCKFYAIVLHTPEGQNQFFDLPYFKKLVNEARAFIVIYTDRDIGKVSAHINLESAGGVEFAQLIPKSAEVARVGVQYDFNQLSVSDLENIAKTSSFSLVVNRGFGEEKFRVTPDNLDPFKLNN
jgi:hypothetical protein